RGRVWGGEGERGAVRILGVTDGDATRQLRHLDAPAAAGTAVARLAPCHVADVHDFATSSKRAREAARGRASPLRVSQVRSSDATSLGCSTGWPRTGPSW